MLLFSFCSSGNESTQEEGQLIIEGIVYVNEVPTAEVLVECYISGQRHSGHTDENGQYTLSGVGAGRTRTYSANYAVRAMNPLNDTWSELRNGTAPVGATLTVDFYFSDDN